MEARIHSEGSSRWLCGSQSGTGTSSSPKCSISFCRYQSVCAVCSPVMPRMDSGPECSITELASCVVSRDSSVCVLNKVLAEGTVGRGSTPLRQDSLPFSRAPQDSSDATEGPLFKTRPACEADLQLIPRLGLRESIPPPTIHLHGMMPN